jgi:hypothetical protein
MENDVIKYFHNPEWYSENTNFSSWHTVPSHDVKVGECRGEVDKVAQVGPIGHAIRLATLLPMIVHTLRPPLHEPLKLCEMHQTNN